MKSTQDLPKQLELAKRRERRRRAKETREQADQNRLLDLREIAPDMPQLRLYDHPVALPGLKQPALCPTCNQELLVFSHHDHAMLICEPCLRLWPTSALGHETSFRKIVQAITSLAEIKLRYTGNVADYHRVYYAANHEKELARHREWRTQLPEQGKRYGRAYYQANRESVLRQQLEHYHDPARHAEECARRTARRDPDKEHERMAKYRAEHREEINERERVRRAANADKERERARKKRQTPQYQEKARRWREANKEKLRVYQQEWRRRKAEELRGEREV